MLPFSDFCCLVETAPFKPCNKSPEVEEGAGEEPRENPGRRREERKRERQGEGEERERKG